MPGPRLEGNMRIITSARRAVKRLIRPLVRPWLTKNRLANALRRLGVRERGIPPRGEAGMNVAEWEIVIARLPRDL